MCNTLYFPRKKKYERAFNTITQNYDLEKSYDDGSQIIFRGDEMLVALSRRHIFFYIYNMHDNKLRNHIKGIIYGER